MEKELKNELIGILDQKEVREFIASRKIQAEDLSLIEKLASFPQNLLVSELHNVFNMNKDGSGKELEGLIKTTQDQNKTLLYQTALEFYNKYGWAISFSLVRVLEGEI